FTRPHGPSYGQMPLLFHLLDRLVDFADGRGAGAAAELTALDHEHYDVTGTLVWPERGEPSDPVHQFAVSVGDFRRAGLAANLESRRSRGLAAPSILLDVRQHGIPPH